MKTMDTHRSEYIAKLESKLEKIEKTIDRKIYYNTLNCELFIEKLQQILKENNND